jgi:PAS domain S-box-containing protein
MSARATPQIEPSNLRHGHQVQFYGDDAFLVDDLAEFIGGALREHGSAVVIATRAHSHSLLRKLRSLGVDHRAATKEGRFISLDAADVMSKFIEGDRIDPSRFSEVCGAALSRAAASSRELAKRVVAFGEMVALLLAEGKSDLAIQVEKLWNELARSHSFTLRCAYPLQSFQMHRDAETLLKICAEHSAVIADQNHHAFNGNGNGNGRSGKSHDHDVVQMQQRARSVESNAEWRLREERFRLFVESVQDYAIFMLDPGGLVTSWNAGAGRIKGYAASEILGRHFSCFYTKEDLAVEKPKNLLEVAAKFDRAEDEGWRVRKDGSKFWAQVVITALRDESGQLIGYGNLTRDLTERRRAEMALRRSESRFRQLTEAVQDYAIFMLDAEGYVDTWNLGAKRIKGYDASEIVGKHFSVFYPEAERNAGKPAADLGKAAQEGRTQTEGWRVRKDGSRFWGSLTITAVRDDSGKLVGFSKVTRDITEQTLAQKALEESERRLQESERSLRQLSHHLLRTQDEERRRIGREIHDSLGQSLSVLKMKLDSVKLPKDQEKAVAAIGEASKIAGECVKEVRTISYLLYPPMLEELGLQSAIPWYAEGFSKRSGIQTKFTVAEEFERLPRDVELVLFRVLQEGLTNVARHSGSPTAEIRLARTRDEVTLEVIDDGKGGPAAGGFSDSGRDWTGAQGVGLRGMRERLMQLGGKLEINSGKGGTQLRAVVPIPEDRTRGLGA